MKKCIIEVPAGIRYVGQWSDFKFNNFPKRCIIDKQLPGCGFTEYCVLGDEHVVICSPRKLLMQNKKDQHPDDIYLVVNEMDKDLGVDKNLDKTPKTGSVIKDVQENQKEVESKNSEIRERIFKELKEYIERRTTEGKSYKILVTYDSYHLIRKMLMELGILRMFYTVIDEFQSILHDARFKSTTEMRFLNELVLSPTSLFVSATPMMEEYLDELRYFKDLPYYELDWATQDPTRIVKPKLDIRTMQSVGTKAEEIIVPFLEGKYDSIIVNRNGSPTVIFAKEIVLYVNSVDHILRVISKLNIDHKLVNILCSDTEENKKRITKRLGRNYTIGTIPKRGEYHKPITFCTRTVYLGADFYSTCAKSYIFSDSNIDSLAVDISEDLPQILGRQRLDENPWKNSATFFYRTTCDYSKISQEEFDKIIEKKKHNTESLMKIYKDTKNNSDRYVLVQNYQKVAKTYNYKDDYVGVNVLYNETTGDRVYYPSVNELVYINEKRAFRIQQIDYKDRFSIFNTLNDKINMNNKDLNIDVSKFITIYDQLKTPIEKLKLLCDFALSSEQEDRDIVNIFIHQLPDSDYNKSYFTNLGPTRIKALSYNPSKIRKALGIIIFDQEKLEKEIYSVFKEGDEILLSDLKMKLAQVYNNVGYQAAPKAKDILSYFEVKDYKETVEIDGVKKRSAGYELIKRLR